MAPVGLYMLIDMDLQHTKPSPDFEHPKKSPEDGTEPKQQTQRINNSLRG
jgi:hypothetical protein